MGKFAKPIYLRSVSNADIYKIPMVYFFFPETKGLALEDVDHLFEKGGITGGVFESRGYPVLPGHHRTVNTESLEKPIQHGEVGMHVETV
jgi:hypothetical protein